MHTYKFRVLIDTAEESDVFRDIEVSGMDNFESFYSAILESFEFGGDQLASFYMSNENWDKGHEITLIDMGMGNALESPSIMRETVIDEVIKKTGQKLILVYDFMRMWCFLIEVIEINDHVIDTPEIVFSVGNAPLEESKEVDLGNEGFVDDGMDLGNDIDDIFSEFDDEGYDDEDYDDY